MHMVYSGHLEGGGGRGNVQWVGWERQEDGGGDGIGWIWGEFGVDVFGCVGWDDNGGSTGDGGDGDGCSGDDVVVVVVMAPDTLNHISNPFYVCLVISIYKCLCL